MSGKNSKNSELEQSPVAENGDRRAAVGAAFERDVPSRSPAAAFEHAGERKFLRALAEALAHRGRQAIEQRYRQRPPFDDRFARCLEGLSQQGGVERLNDTAIDEQAAVTVLSKAGQPVDIGNLQPRGFERLDQRVGEPLAELVKRYDPASRDRRMPAAVAERQAGKPKRTWPDRPEYLQQKTEDFRGRNLVTARRPVVEEITRPRRFAEQVEAVGANFAQPVQQGCPSLDPEDLVCPAVLNGLGEPVARQSRQCSGVGTPQVCGIGREETRLHRAQTRQREALGARPRPASLGLMKTPVRPGSRIEQDRNEGEV